MALKTVKLGGFVEENIQSINENFTALERDKAALADLPSKVSQLENDSRYQTEEQVAAKVAELVAAAPEALDTLKELAEALGNDPSFAATITAQLGQKVDKEEGKGLSSNDFTQALKEKLEGIENYVLPVAGEALGGVKNGGNVVIQPDGTLTAPEGEGAAKPEQADFTADDSRWGELSGGTYTLTVASGGRTPLKVYRKQGESYGEVMAGVSLFAGNILVESHDRFDGRLVLI